MDCTQNANISVYVTEEQIRERVAQIGAELTKKFQGESVVFVSILRGSVFFATELAKRIELPMVMEFMVASSYGSGTESSGNVKITKDLDSDIRGKNVIIVEDIVDTGYTLEKLLSEFRGRQPKSLTVCTLLDKPERRMVKDIQVDYIGFEIPNKFVVGYGLDYDQRYRNLPYIGFVEE